ncbi:MAG: type II toxin-antitoxin system Phd/YefM family antitoxin [Nitrospirae bacterium]|nr:type II toxin-antitoxin system Phd/YefM family antitoxin [Nitrospirota bacterium]
MKTITVRDLQKKVRECVDAAQSDRIVITRHGKPAAVLVGVAGTDWETVVLEANAGFWRLIEKRRKQPTVTMAEMRKRVGAGRVQNAKGR